MPATIALVLDTRRAKKTSKYPVKLRVTHDRETRYYQTVFDLTEQDWQKLQAPRVSDDLHFIRTKLKEIESAAGTIAGRIAPFGFLAFESSFLLCHSLFRQRKSKLHAATLQLENEFDYTPLHKRFPILVNDKCKIGKITWAYQQYIKSLIREDRIGSAVAYHCSYVSLKNFRGDVSLSEITVSFLQAYEKNAKDNGLAKSTIGIYLRPLRAVLNVAIADGLLSKDRSYPFGAKKYQIPSAKKAKKALTLEDVKRIYYYPCRNQNGGEQMAKDYWLFSYFGNGMNPKDIARLKWRDFDGEYITFERAKSERTLRANPIIITAYVNEDMKAIIQRWGNADRTTDNFIFPVLEKGLTAMRCYDRIQNFVYNINYWMREILRSLEIDKKATTYVARHTFSTIMKKSGVSTEFIKEALGHVKLETTEGYLDSFDNEFKKELAYKLMSFKTGFVATGVCLGENQNHPQKRQSE